MKRSHLAGATLAAVVVTGAAIVNLATSPPIRPDPKLTPGAVDPTVTQANVASTICTKGYATQHRPPDDAKWRKEMAAICAAYGTTYQPQAAEMDHLISIELGGAPSDPRNIWSQPYAGQWNAHIKDQLENELHREICTDEIDLKAAQQEIATDWIASYQKHLGKK